MVELEIIEFYENVKVTFFSDRHQKYVFNYFLLTKDIQTVKRKDGTKVIISFYIANANSVPGTSARSRVSSLSYL